MLDDGCVRSEHVAVLKNCVNEIWCSNNHAAIETFTEVALISPK
jgi:hypothetical protein